MNTRSTGIKLGISALALGVGVTTITASPLEVHLLNSHYSTYVFVATDVGWSTGVSRTNFSPVPSNDSLHFDYSDPLAPTNVGTLGAEATADLFRVSVRSYCHYNQVLLPAYNSTARAHSEISFAPVTSGTATLSFDWHVAQEWFYSEGAVSLFDHTANQMLWNYDWNFAQFIPGSSRTLNADGSQHWAYLLETDFDANHTYTLTMREQSWADSDRQQIAFQMSGLTVVPIVPEPATFTLVCLGGAALLAQHRRRRDRRD